ncbi:MAG: hypothetical protein IPH11_00685 [Ignavibacteriales bacterium]|nr:hypothetical protein [Ignavibacteriales bacterium]
MREVALRPRSAGRAFSSFDPVLRGKHSHPSTPFCGASILILRQAQDDRSPSMVLVLRMTGVRSLQFDCEWLCIEF